MVDNAALTNALPNLPSGTVIGRLTAQDGPAEQLTLAQLAASLPSSAPYRIAFSWPGGVPGNSQLIGDHQVTIGVTFPPNFGVYAQHKSQAGGTANATGSTVFTIATAASGTGSYTAIGTVTFAAGTITPTFATTGGIAQRVPQGNLIRIIGPGTADATFANPFFTLVGYES